MREETTPKSFSIAGDKDILLVVTHSEDVLLVGQLEINVSEGRTVVIQDDTGTVDPGAIILGSGFNVVSGSFQWHLEGVEPMILQQHSFVRTGGRFYNDDNLELQASLTIEEGGYMENRGGVRITGTTSLLNAGILDINNTITYESGITQNPPEQVHTYLINEASGVINIHEPV